ncbi:MAG: TIGR00730 family Rossman fold protein [Pseudomonadales bacterium]
MDERKMSEAWRMFRIQSELVDGIEKLAKLGQAVSIYGSARTKEGSFYYQQAQELGRLLASNNLAVISGGGPGIMEAVNRGAYPEAGASVGLNISLADDEPNNLYQDLSLSFRYFFVRKFMFVKYAVGFVIFPGGFGTLDELFEALTLVQTEKVGAFPIVLVGEEYWGGLYGWMQQTMQWEGCVDKKDLELLQIVGSAEQATKIILDHTASIKAIPGSPVV